jgi:hypothetical protein
MKIRAGREAPALLAAMTAALSQQGAPYPSDGNGFASLKDVIANKFSVNHDNIKCWVIAQRYYPEFAARTF